MYPIPETHQKYFILADVISGTRGSKGTIKGRIAHPPSSFFYHVGYGDASLPSRQRVAGAIGVATGVVPPPPIGITIPALPASLRTARVPSLIATVLTNVFKI